jgi:hypothetical protein
LVAPARVYALELGPEILERGREFVAGQGETNRVFVQDDARNVAQRIPAPVGFVLIANTFHGVPDKTALTPAWFTKYWDRGAGYRSSTSIP